MSKHNVTAVYTHWRTIDDTAMRLLTHMALVSFDPPDRQDRPACHYFGGWETQAAALGYQVPSREATDTYSVFSRQNIERAVRRIRKRLRDVGAIKVVSPPGGFHTTTTYYVVAYPVGRTRQSSPGGTDRSCQGGPAGPVGGDRPVLQRY
jgi:hypothetical protein